MSNNEQGQEHLLEALRARDPDVEVMWSARRTTVSHLSGNLSDPRDSDGREIAQEFLRSNMALFGIRDPDGELSVRREKTDGDGWRHVFFEQRFRGLPVWSHGVSVHVDGRGRVQVADSSFEPDVDVDPAPAVTSDRAVEVARAHAEAAEPVRPERVPYEVIYTQEGVARLAWVFTIPGWDRSLDGTAREPARWEYFVDAHTGDVISRFNRVLSHTVTSGAGLSVDNPPHLNEAKQTLQTYHDHGKQTYRLQDDTRQGTDKYSVLTYDANGALFASGLLSEDSDDDWKDTTGKASTDHATRTLCQAAEVDAHRHTAKVCDYYRTTFGRVGIDNNFNGPGTAIDIRSYVHVRTTDATGKTVAWNNAQWTGSVMQYGDGQYDGVDGDWGDQTFYSGALDIVAHEFTHGVTDYEITDPQNQPHGFTYNGESGAANESFSDIFAAFIDRDWRQGDRIVVGKLTDPGKMWRDLSDPTRGLAYDQNDTITQFLAKGVPQPDHYSIRYQGSADYGGVHINSGILNFAGYLSTHGGVSHRTGRIPLDIPVYVSGRRGIGWERSEQIYYLALTSYLDGKTDPTFLDVRRALLDACKQLLSTQKYGVSQCDYNTLRTAFYAVGVHPQNEPYGPDPMITPWGIWTGTGAPYQSPDIWVDDGAGNKVNAAKGVMNSLCARVLNIGDQNATGVKVRFSYAPFGFGYAHKDFKPIDEKALDLSPGEISTVTVAWDLTNLAEDHGGTWPYPIDTFAHFCVRVEVIVSDQNDTNPCNNAAQHNFVDVGTTTPAEIDTALVVANPSAEPAKVALQLSTTLPRGWRLAFTGIKPGRPTYLAANEKRVVHLVVQVPEEPLISAPINGAFSGSVSGLVPADLVGRLDEATYSPRNGSFRGRVSGTTVGAGNSGFRGEMEGRVIDVETGEFRAAVRLIVADPETDRPYELSGRIRGRLIPERRVSVSQHLGSELIGGIDLNFQRRV